MNIKATVLVLPSINHYCVADPGPVSLKGI